MKNFTVSFSTPTEGGHRTFSYAAVVVFQDLLTSTPTASGIDRNPP
jgi:hypothetical protein